MILGNGMRSPTTLSHWTGEVPDAPRVGTIGPIIGKGHAKNLRRQPSRARFMKTGLHPGSKHCSARTLRFKERADSQSHSGRGLGADPLSRENWTQSWLWYARSRPGLEKQRRSRKVLSPSLSLLLSFSSTPPTSSLPSALPRSSVLFLERPLPDQELRSALKGRVG